MEQIPQEEINGNPEDDKKKLSKAAIAAAALGAVVAAGGPADVAAQEGDAGNVRSSHEYVMEGSEQMRNRATAMVRHAAHTLGMSGMSRARAEQFIWDEVDMELGAIGMDRSGKTVRRMKGSESESEKIAIAKELLPALEQQTWPADLAEAAKIVTSRVRSIAGSFDPNSAEGRALRDSLNSYKPNTNREDAYHESPDDPWNKHIPGGESDDNDPYKVVPKNRAPGW